mgnify:FL=1|jgi:DNA-binding response OmpR family regulator
MRLQIYTDESDSGERLIRAVKQEGVTVVREETEDADAVVLFLNGQESGFRRLETLRIKWQCPVVVVGHEERVYCYEEIRSLELGADDYVPAGTASNVLLLRLQRLFRLYRGQNGPFYYRNGLLECRDKRDYEWQGKPLRLTGKEYQLLHLLLTHAGEVVTLQEILRQVWNQKEETTDALNTMLRKLRGKLQGTPYKIVNRYGMGYQITAGQ